MPTGNQGIDNISAQFPDLNEANKAPPTSEYTRKYPCRSTVTGMFTDCGPKPGNIECYSQFYGSSF